MAAQAKKRLDRMEVYEEIVRRIKKEGRNEIEINLTEWAPLFGLKSSAAIDHHIRKLLEDGLIDQLSGKRGERQTKFFKLPSNSYASITKNNKPKILIHSSDTIDHSILKELHGLVAKQSIGRGGRLLQGNEKPSEPEVEIKKVKKVEKTQPSTEVPIKNVQLEEEKMIADPARDSQTILPTPFQVIPPKPEQPSLDVRIEKYLQEQQKVPTAEFMLTQKDRDVYSVMVETMGQFMEFMKDLQWELTTHENKEMFDEMIKRYKEFDQKIKEKDEEIKSLRAEILYLKAQNTNMQKDPDKIRMFQQRHASTVKGFTRSGNLNITTNRMQFENEILELAQEWARYDLGIQEEE